MRVADDLKDKKFVDSQHHIERKHWGSKRFVGSGQAQTLRKQERVNRKSKRG